MGGVNSKQLHLVRHGEVYNPDRVLYGRIPGFLLSDLGHEMARAAAEDLRASGRPVAKLFDSPLERAQESAAPIAELLGLPIETEERIIEPTNYFEGKVNHGPGAEFKKPRHWHKFWNPFRPSWGEAYRSVAKRVRAAMDEAWDSTPEGDIVMGGPQSPLGVARRDSAGHSPFHDQPKRR